MLSIAVECIIYAKRRYYTRQTIEYKYMSSIWHYFDLKERGISGLKKSSVSKRAKRDIFGLHKHTTIRDERERVNRIYVYWMCETINWREVCVQMAVLVMKKTKVE